ncbi:hypothetical protein [Candidatus Galacturonibacter soehngenii]|uniref:DUF3955 domain-containing protein n=1 Tax=Candidatus Galacturonatibacter soehngenii TaxID=2307010 RepID=A0A7V7UAX4_9FIRM|nr:hypothetical protein [Candidatus Galacturonibacter soehngenii]KAB1435903.1 hypothetical protein F7O84_16135 [Candidatus Galacturonibacter soehngenii]
MNKTVRIMLAIITVVIGVIISGNSLISIYTMGIDNITIVKMFSIFFGIFMIILGIIVGLFILKNKN